MPSELKPCKCGGEGIERIDYGYPIIICGVECDRTLGSVVLCNKCGYRTNAYYEPYKAIEEWNSEQESKR